MLLIVDCGGIRLYHGDDQGSKKGEESRQTYARLPSSVPPCDVEAGRFFMTGESRPGHVTKLPTFLQIMADKLTYAEQLARDMLKAGKAPLSTHERLSLLEQLYDSLLFSWIEHVKEGIYKGSAAISYQLERVREEVSGLRKDHGVTDKTGMDAIPGFNPTLIVLNGTGERIEA